MYVPGVYMGRDVMILMRANPLQGSLEGVDPENRDFFGPEMATREASGHLGLKMAQVMDLPPSKSLVSPSAI
jgi:hypothetical protein